MAQRNGAAIHVDLAAVQTQFFFYGEILPGESLIHLDQINLFQLQPGFFERQSRGRNRTAAHDFGINSGNAPAHNASQRLHIAFFRLLQGHEHHGSAAIHNAAGVSGCHSAVFAESGLQFGQYFHGGIRPQMIVLLKHFARRLASFVLERHGSDLFSQAAGLLRRARLLLGLKSEFIHLFPANALLLGIKLGGVGHIEAAVGVEQSNHERIFHLAFTQPKAPTRAANHMRRLGHGFHATRQHRVCFSKLNKLSAGDNCLHTRAAQAVYRQRGNFIR